MTTIAYRDGVMAADSGSWMGDACHRWARKLARGPDGTLYGTAGHAAECEAFLAWVRAGCAGSAPRAREEDDGRGSSFVVLVAPPEGGVRIRTARGDEVYPEAAYFAVGAGKEVCFGALFMGATAEQALHAAMEHGCSAIGSVCTIIRR
ncbi:hypothetical protein ACN9MF_28345 [Methylobacterium fujisawaense]|uniref:hypothetical protein n=1 Tax=Methylobacterium fujisawaense TaxID=107400 RepID=UPI003CF8F899